MAIPRIAEAGAVLKFPIKAGPSIASIVGTLQVLFWDATLDSKRADCLNG